MRQLNMKKLFVTQFNLPVQYIGRVAQHEHVVLLFQTHFVRM